MKQFLTTMAGVFAGLILFLVGVPFLLIVIAAGATRPAPLPSDVVLQLDLRTAMTDQDVQNPLSGFGRRSNSVMSVIETLKRAEDDGRVKGLIVRLPETGMEPGSADEIRLALKRFEASGKPVIAHSQGLYQAGVVTSTYMVGAAAGEFWMQPGAALQVTGLAVEDVFFKRFFDKYAKGKFGAYLLSRHADGDSQADRDVAAQRIEEAQLFIEAAHACEARLTAEVPLQ